MHYQIKVVKDKNEVFQFSFSIDFFKDLLLGAMESSISVISDRLSGHRALWERLKLGR
jgi:hypothetical protein